MIIKKIIFSDKMNYGEYRKKMKQLKEQIKKEEEETNEQIRY